MVQRGGCPPRELPRLDTRESRLLHAILDAIRQQRACYLRLRVVVVEAPPRPLLIPAHSRLIIACGAVDTPQRAIWLQSKEAAI